MWDWLESGGGVVWAPLAGLAIVALALKWLLNWLGRFSRNRQNPAAKSEIELDRRLNTTTQEHAPAAAVPPGLRYEKQLPESAQRSRRVEPAPQVEASGPLRQPLPVPAPIAVPSAGNAAGEEKGDYVAVTVHYGTDRRDTRIADDVGSRYTYERAPTDGGLSPMSYGTCQVSIPKSHTVGGLEDRSWWQWATLQGRTPDKFVMVLSVAPSPAAGYFSGLKAAVARSDKKDAFVFVHGFSVSFADAARRTAQMAFDLKFPGAPIMFSWPTPDLSANLLTSYTTSENNAILSTDRFRQFLKDVIERSGASTVHLIAHSMGNRIVTDVLAMLDTAENAGLKARIGQVILTAPDIDAAVFTSVIAPRLARVSPRITLYASSKDRALQVSQSVHSFPRIGEFQSLTRLPAGIDVIDATAVYDGSNSINHSYYGDSEPVIGDLCYLLGVGVRAAERNLTLIAAATSSGDKCWSVVKCPLDNIYAAISARGR